VIGIYARVSTEEQAKSGFSIDSQIREGKKKAGTDEVKIYIDDGVSGEFLDRPALNRLREDVKAGIIKKIICYDPDRLSRKLMNQLILTDEFDRMGVELVFVNGEYAKTPEGNLFYSMRGAIAEFEKAKITERMSRGRREKARQGKVIKNYDIYGYGWDEGASQFVINEHEAEVVRLIFDLFTKPNELVKGINGIAKYLTSKGVKTKRDVGVWHRNVVRQILMNRAYIGEFYQNRWNTEGMLGNKHLPPEERVKMKERPKDEWILVPIPPIIDKVQFEHAQRLLEESRRRSTKKGKRTYLLSGLLRCGECGNTLTGRMSTNWGKKVPQYIDRKNYSGAKHTGCGLTVNCGDIDEQVWETVRAWLDHPDEIAVAKAEEQPMESFEAAELVRLEKELEKVKKGRKRLIQLFADGEEDLGAEDIRKELKRLQEKAETLEAQRKEIQAKMTEAKNEEFSRNLLKEAAEYYISKGGGEKELTIEDKQELIRYFIREIRVFPGPKIQIFTF
jgi:site-specific DNA recombinase